MGDSALANTTVSSVSEDLYFVTGSTPFRFNWKKKKKRDERAWFSYK
jgi:hypothetical protein